MKLLLDIGNSNIDWAVENKNGIQKIHKFSYQKKKLPSKYDAHICLKKKPDAILLSCVVDKLLIKNIQLWSKRKWNIIPWQAKVSSYFNELKNGYDDTSKMGVDRWLAMIAAWEKYKEALCVVDCGTAVTVDLIDSYGQHIGGYIVPGIELMQKTLISNADKIKVNISNEVNIQIPKNTKNAIRNGASLATIAMIDNSVKLLRKKTKKMPKCIITGGMGKQIRPYLNKYFKLDNKLVLRGLSIMYNNK